MNGFMIERRYGSSNRDWLCGLTRRSCAWSGATTALVFDDRRKAVRALARVRRLSEKWPDGEQFQFALIHDRRHLPDYFASTDVVLRTYVRSWSSFERSFVPVMHDDGSLLWEWSKLSQPVDVQRTFTVVECESRLYVTAGIHFVNRIGYLRTERPWRSEHELVDWRYD